MERRAGLIVASYENTAIAIRWKAGQHDIIGEVPINVDVDCAGMKVEFPFYDVSDDQGAYIDRATLLPGIGSGNLSWLRGCWTG